VVGGLRDAGRQVEHRRQQESERHDAGARQVGQVPGEDERADGIGNGDYRDREHRTHVVDLHLEPDEGGHPGQPQQQPDHAPCVERVAGRPVVREQRADQGYGGDQQPGE
jgi:hypothetical protein